MTGGARLLVAWLLVASVATMAVAPAAGTDAPSADGNATLVVEGDRLTLANATGQALYGRTDLPPGETLTVMLRASGTRPFLKSTETTVDAAGRFRATFDFSLVQPSTTFDVRVMHNGTELTRGRGETVACDGDCRTPPSRPTATLFPYAPNATLSAGPGQAIHGRTNLSAGTEVTVRLAAETGRVPPLVTTAVVDQRGRFRAVADLQGVSPGTRLDVTVHLRSVRLDAERVRVGPCERNCAPPPGARDDLASPFVDRNGSVVDTVRGGTVGLPILVGDRGRATLSVGGPNGSYRFDAVLVDRDGDGEVTVLFDTGAAGNLSRALGAAGPSDEVRISGTPSLPPNGSLLDAGEYPLTVFQGANAGGTPALLVVYPQSSDSDAVTEFGFGRTPLTVERGRTATLPLRLDESRTATVVVDGEAYSLRAVVRDGSGDERVRLDYETTGDGRVSLSAVAPADEVRVLERAGALAAGEYDLSLYRGTVPTGEEPPPDLWAARGTLIVAESPGTPTGGDTPVDRLSLPALGALGLGGLLAVVGLSLLTGVVER
ncbi:BGTF surface domain-containing protein [Halorarius halobius]|uniref:BGTF surface domain-containing protein n=1 Tax=Halorarius halobius TaxID=2962671 RepID=UPI0020CEFE94|nr:BGTF surface domain-containing protein [Halorarius halobius]